MEKIALYQELDVSGQAALLHADIDHLHDLCKAFVELMSSHVFVDTGTQSWLRRDSMKSSFYMPCREREQAC